MSGPDRTRRAAALGVAFLVVLLAGCSLPDPVPGSRPPVYADVDDLSRAFVARFAADRTVLFRSTIRLSETAPAQTNIQTVDGAIRLGPDGVYSTSTTVARSAERPEPAGFVVRPDGVYVRPAPLTAPATAARPWVRLDPAFGDPYSRSFAAAAAQVRTSGSRLFCFTELGRATIVDTGEEYLTGFPVTRYRLRIDLTAPAADEPSAASCRSRGLTEIEATVYAYSTDRIARCEIDQALPGGRGRVTGEQIYWNYGGQVDVSAPPASQVVALP